jgi:hypothetical protein
MSEILPDLAAKVISADLRNLVKKVSEGVSLTQAEREMMERAVIDGTLPDELQQARLAALARAYALGKALTASQQKELSALIPQGKPIAKKLTTESYRFKLAHYVPILGIDKDEDGKKAKDPERKLKRWIAKGREKTPPDLPPFDAPEHMAEWWRRNMEWRVPEYLLRLENHDQSAHQAKATAPEESQQEVNAAAANSSAVPKTDALGEPMMFDTESDLTADVGLLQIRQLVSTLHKQMVRAFEGGRLTDGANYMRQWEKAVESLRKWEKDIVKIQEGKGEVLRARVVNTELGRVLNVISQSYFNSLLSILDTYAPEIPGTDRRQLALTYRDKCFRHLKDSQFSSVYQPPEEVPPHE